MASLALLLLPGGHEWQPPHLLCVAFPQLWINCFDPDNMLCDGKYSIMSSCADKLRCCLTVQNAVLKYKTVL